MHFATVAIFAASVGYVAAANCPAQTILDTCLSSETAKVKACAPTDWICQCQNQNAVLTCYNNCPNDPGLSAAQGQHDAWCAAAAPLISASQAAAATMPHTSTMDMPSATDASATESASAAATTSPNAAASFQVASTGVFAVLMGLAGLL